MNTKGGSESRRKGEREAGRVGGRESGRQGEWEGGRAGGRESGRQGGRVRGDLDSCYHEGVLPRYGKTAP